MIVLISVSTLTESRLVNSRAQTNPHIPGRTHGNIQPQEVKQQQSPELRVRPRPVVVHCHPDSMRVVVQADMFDRGLQVDGRHLQLGSESVSEGSSCGAVPSGEAEFTIQAHLRDCGAKLSVSKHLCFYLMQLK